MSKINFFDKTTLNITGVQAHNLELELSRSGDGFITIGPKTFKKSSISSIDHLGGLTEADVRSVFPTSHQVKAGKQCIGKRSIQLAINNAAKQTGKGWEEKVRSAKWREAVRIKLHEQTDDWCDYKANSCVCE